MTPDQLMVRMLLSPEQVGRSLADGHGAIPRRRPVGRPTRSGALLRRAFDAATGTVRSRNGDPMAGPSRAAAPPCPAPAES